MTDIDRDDFWDIDKLVPKKTAPLSTFSTKEKVVDVEIATEASITEEESENAESRKLTPPPPSSKPTAKEELVYSPKSGLIKRVSVRHTPDKYDFHANFVKATSYLTIRICPNIRS